MKIIIVFAGTLLVILMNLAQLAQLLKDGFVQSHKNHFMWTVKIRQKQGERLATTAEVLAVQDKWFEIMQRTLDEIAKIE